MLNYTAPAKLNLFLHIGPVRDSDQIHDLQSLVMFSDESLADRLQVQPAADLKLEVSGPFAKEAGPLADNLVLRVAHAWQALTGQSAGACFQLEKNVPVGAGLGGGSSDAAACLRALETLYPSGLSETQLRAMAMPLGADIPVCLMKQACHVKGGGEQLEPAIMPDLPVVIINCRKPLLTNHVFSCFERIGGAQALWQADFPQEPLSFEALMTALAKRRNDLTHAAQSLCPEIALVLEQCHAQNGVLLTRMSGSGPTCFAVFAQAEQAFAASWTLSCAFPEWWVRSAILSGQKLESLSF